MGSNPGYLLKSSLLYLFAFALNLMLIVEYKNMRVISFTFILNRLDFTVQSNCVLCPRACNSNQSLGHDLHKWKNVRTLRRVRALLQGLRSQNCVLLYDV